MDLARSKGLAMDKIKTKLKEFLKTFRILKDPFALIFYIVMLIYVLLLIIPMIWMIISTFKDNIDMALEKAEKC